MQLEKPTSKRRRKLGKACLLKREQEREPGEVNSKRKRDDYWAFKPKTAPAYVGAVLLAHKIESCEIVEFAVYNPIRFFKLYL